MIKPLDILDKEESKATKKSRGSSKKEIKKASSRLGLFIGFVMLLFISGIMIFNHITTLSFQKKNPSKKEVSLQSPLSKVEPDTILEEAKKRGVNIGGQLAKAGQEVGAAILGQTVKFIQRAASESAQQVASTAASVVIQNTVPGILNQIDKLPEDQRKEVRKIICE